MDSSSTHAALREAVAIAGSQAAFGEVCGVTQAAVWKWLSLEKDLPAEHVLAVEAATGVSRHSLRPDIYPDESGIGAAAPDHAAADPTREVRS